MQSDFQQLDFKEVVEYYNSSSKQFLYVTPAFFNVELNSLCVKLGEKVVVGNRTFARVMVLTLEKAQELISLLQESLNNNKG